MATSIGMLFPIKRASKVDTCMDGVKTYHRTTFLSYSTYKNNLDEKFREKILLSLVLKMAAYAGKKQRRRWSLMPLLILIAGFIVVTISIFSIACYLIPHG